MTPDSPWFYIFVTSGAALLATVARWVWIAVRDKFREWVREPVQKAKEQAAVAAVQAEKVQDTIGQKNGQADLMTMVSEIRESQRTQEDWQRAHDNATATILRETRAELLALTHTVADLHGRVAALEVTRPPFDEAG